VRLCDVMVEVVEIRGHCDAGLKVGERIVLSGANLDLQKSNKVCYWALSDLMPALYSLQLGHDPKELGLSTESGIAYMCCSDPGPPRTPGGNVVFKIRQIPLDETSKKIE
jgi:uncharacterized repeat protein (TIGR04076 family)